MAPSPGSQRLLAAAAAASLVLGASYNLLWVCSRRLIFSRPPLKFRYDRQQRTHSFKILQLADLHFGENAWDDWGPEQDRMSAMAMKSVLNSEHPDLVVLSGDQITANNIDENATTYYRIILNILIDAQVRWASTFGNHDDAALETRENGTVIYTDAKTSREDLTRIDMSYRGSHTKKGPADVFGTSNYALTLYMMTDVGVKPAINIYFFDSGGGSLPQMDDDSQVEWFKAQTKESSSDLPSVAFQHIPTSNDFAYRDDGSCGGYDGEGGVSRVASDSGLLQALVDAKVHFLSVGHNHGNDFCCSYDVMSLCFGRHSGYGGYGTWDRGARVYLLEFDEESQFSWSSYVRMESGEIVDRYWPQGSNYYSEGGEEDVDR